MRSSILPQAGSAEASEVVTGRARFLGVRLSLILLSSVFTFPAFAQTGFEFFPGRPIYPTYRADALAHQLSLSKIADNKEWIGVIGGELPLALYSWSNSRAEGVAGASVFSRIIKTPGHVVVSTVDYRIDFSLDANLSDILLRVGWGHISSHFADDAIENLGAHSINSLKDYVQIGVSHFVGCIHGSPYCQVLYCYHREPLPDRHWIFQFGSDFGDIPITSWMNVYSAFDIKLKEETGWGSTQSYQLGFLFFSGEHGNIRLSYTYRTGYEERGQFYDRITHDNLITLTLGR
jgi:hypothetical protein